MGRLMPQYVFKGYSRASHFYTTAENLGLSDTDLLIIRHVEVHKNSYTVSHHSTQSLSNSRTWHALDYVTHLSGDLVIVQLLLTLYCGSMILAHMWMHAFCWPSTNEY
jgi:hypothetical protein